MAYLININTFADYEDLSVNIKPSRVLAFVKKAQDLDLSLFMGKAFWTDFIQYFSNDVNDNLIIDGNCPQIYLDLFNGKTYTDTAGHAIAYDGMIPALVYWTFARYIAADMVHYSGTGA